MYHLPGVTVLHALSDDSIRIHFAYDHDISVPCSQSHREGSGLVGVDCLLGQFHLDDGLTVETPSVMMVLMVFDLVE